MKTKSESPAYAVPKPVYTLLDRLCSYGYEAYLVGGCVRDLLLDRPPHDFDINTSAPPETVQKLFSGYPLFTTGIRFGTVSVQTDCGAVEITTFRGESAYTDGRRPDTVHFHAGLREDLLRRDFLMNAICLDKQGYVVDPLGGQESLRRRVIAACGDADQRFTEDALRVLRGVRFACQLGFSIEPHTLSAMRRAASRLRLLPTERISGELCSILCSPSPERLFHEFSWCLNPLFPGTSFSPKRLDRLPMQLAERLLPLAPMEERLQIPRAERVRLKKLRDIWDRLPVSNGAEARLLLQFQDEQTVEQALLCYDQYHGTKQAVLLSKADAHRLHALPVTGKALQAMGFRGKEIGLVLNALRREVLLSHCPPGKSWREQVQTLLLHTGTVLQQIPPKLRGLCGLTPFSQQVFPVGSRSRLPKEAKSVLLFVFPYFSAKACGGNLSKYAAVPDYHRVVPQLLAPVAEKLERAFPQHHFAVFTDSSPNREVSLAVQAGLGEFGDNGLLLHPVYGSFVFIGEIVTDLPLFFFAQPGGTCLHCGRCKAACPVGLDKTRCVSALTQKKGDLTEEEQALVKAGGLVWGCDLCQDCCPLNRKTQETPLEEFRTDVLATLSRHQVPSLVRTRAFGFRGPKPLLRNLTLLEEENKP